MKVLTGRAPREPLREDALASSTFGRSVPSLACVLVTPVFASVLTEPSPFLAALLCVSYKHIFQGA